MLRLRWPRRPGAAFHDEYSSLLGADPFAKLTATKLDHYPEPSGGANPIGRASTRRAARVPGSEIHRRTIRAISKCSLAALIGCEELRASRELSVVGHPMFGGALYFVAICEVPERSGN